jgi:hypothetical protein
MSLGCGAYAGNITSDNITPLHLINIKRLAYERPRGLAAKPAASEAAAPKPVAPSAPPVDFVAEDDVRRAIREGRVIRVTRKAIVTPAARDAALGKGVLEVVD